MSDPGIPAAEPASVIPTDRKRRRWPWVFVALILLMAAVVALLPTILSAGFMRQYLLGRINRGLAGHIDIADWSLGWGGCELRNVRVFDRRQAEVLSVTRIRSHLSFGDLLRGRYDCGETDIEEPNFVQLVIAPDGTVNLQEIFPKATGSRRRAARITPVQLSGNFKITRLRGTIVDRRDGVTEFVEPSTARIHIKNARDPVEYELELKKRGAATQPVPRSGRARMMADLQAALSGNGDGRLPLGGAAVAGAEALIRAAGRPAIAAAMQPATRPTTQPESARHRRRRP